MLIRRIAPVLMSLLLVLGIIPALAAEPVFNLADYLPSAAAEGSDTVTGSEKENNIFIRDIDRTAGTVTVDYRLKSAATLVLEVSEDDGTNLKIVKTLRQTATADGYPEYQSYTFQTDLPEYFQLEARIEGLPSGETADPYISVKNLKSIREITDRTVNDWPGREILNLDDDDTTNYAVLAEGVHLIQDGGGISLQMSDDDSGNFALSGDSTMLAGLGIESGSKLVVAEKSGGSGFAEYRCVQVTGVSASDGHLSVTAEKEEREDSFFDYTEFHINYPVEFQIDKEISFGKNPEADIKLKGTLNLQLIFLGYLNFKSDPEEHPFYIGAFFINKLTDLEVEATGSYEKSVELFSFDIPGVSIPGIGGLELGVEIPIKAEEVGTKFVLNLTTETYIEVSPKLKSGFDVGMKARDFTFSLLEAGGEIDIGFHTPLELKADELPLKMALGATHYACIVGKLCGGEYSGGPNKNDYWHACVKESNGISLPDCLSGTLGYMYAFEGEVNFIVFKKSFSLPIVDAFRYYWPYYWSILFGDHDINKTCPHQAVRMDVTVKGSDGTKLEGADVSYVTVAEHYEPKSTGKTNSEGKTSLYVAKQESSSGGVPFYKVTAKWNRPGTGNADTLSASKLAPLVVSEPVSVEIVIPNRFCSIHFLDTISGPAVRNMPPDVEIGPDATTYRLPSAIPERDKYRFKGWLTDIQSTLVQPGDTVPINPNIKDYNFYAQWELITYQIRYDANGGENAPDPQTKIISEPICLSNDMPVREKYVFMGWSTDKNAEMPEYGPGQRYTEDHDLTLYAVWRIVPVVSCMITYDANAGGEGTAPLPQYANLGETVQLSKVPATWDDEHTFLGWSLVPNPPDSLPMFLPGDNYTVDMDVTMYAIWQENPVMTYAVDYDAGPGSGAPETQVQIDGRILRLSSKKPAYEGHKFTAWRSSEDGQLWNPGDYYTMMVSTTMEAEWEPDYHIIEGNGSSWAKLSGKDLRFRANGPMDLFETLLIDREAVPADGHYQVSSGSTICDLEAGYLNKLALGEHKIRFVYSDGQTEEGNFFIVEKKGLPSTGDDTPIVLWCSALVLSLGVLAFALRRRHPASGKRN